MAKEELQNDKNLSRVLLRPRITEKSTFSVEKDRAYVFDVAQDATKGEIAEAVKTIYKVTPIKIRIAKVPAKRVFLRGRRGVKSGNKKAYVYLKKSDKIEFV